MASISQELKQAVLQAAIQGKLTEQLPEDGDARDLLAQIKAEKERLIKEKKIKKEKPLEPISEDEVPFDIPSNWEWVRLLSICKSIQDGDHQPPPQTTFGIPFLVISNVSKGMIDMTNTRHVPVDYFKSLSYERTGEYGDILFTVTGSYGIAIKVDIDEDFCFQRHMALLKPVVDASYLFYALTSPCIKSQCDDKATGIAQKTVGIKSLQQMIVPFPPLAEQHRIVARVEELMAKIDELAKVENELKALHQAFPGDMKSALLQAAMQGKLTEQRPEDGDARDYLKIIQETRTELCKKRLIKTGKYNPEIDKDFSALPQNWTYTKIGSISTLVTKQTGFDYSKYIKPSLLPKGDDDSLPLIQTRNFKGDRFDFNAKYYVPIDIVKQFPNLHLNSECLLLSIVGSIGNVGYYHHNKEGFIGGAIAKINLIDNSIYKYLYWYLQSPEGNAEIAKNYKATAQATITVEDVRNIIVPFPPLAEQRRIVERLDKLLPLCDSLQTEL